MRYLILSDIHANLEALDAVRAAAPPVDAYVVLGDVVGYGASPNEVIDCVRQLKPCIIIRGNHDKVAAGLELPESFNPTAERAAAWTLDALTESSRAWLEALPAGPVMIDATMEICHGAPDHEDDYIFSTMDARLAFEAASRPACLFGHTHVAICYWLVEDDPFDIRVMEPTGPSPMLLRLDPGCRYLINPGAVGQPRDGDPRAAYGVYDSTERTVTIARVSYPIERAQARIIEVGLPEVLAKRLGLGR